MFKFVYKKFGIELDLFNLVIMVSYWKEKLFEVGGLLYFLKIYEFVVIDDIIMFCYFEQIINVVYVG